jgi:DNA ligase (NAD+)
MVSIEMSKSSSRSLFSEETPDDPLAAASTVAAEVSELRALLERHNYLYYVEARPEITDREYDCADGETGATGAGRHPELRSADSPSQKVGGEPITGFQQVQHRIPMLSIDNVFEESELEEWDAGLRRSLDREQLEYSIEYKIDGVAISLIWEDGRLVRGATRGTVRWATT